MTVRPFAAALLAAAALGTAAASASTVAPPANLGELARLSRATVLARAGESWTEAGAGPSALPRTLTRFTLLRAVAGAALPETFVVVELGGVAGDRGAVVAGAPVYEAGRTYLLFLDAARMPQRPSGAPDLTRWRSRMLSYGLLVEDEAGGLLVPLEQAGALDLAGDGRFEPVGAYEKDLLLAHLAEVAQGRAWSRERAGWAAAPSSLLPPPAQCQYLTYPGTGLPVRWFGYEVGTTTATIRHTTPGQVGIADGGVSAVQQGSAVWTNHPDSIIRYNYAGSAPRTLTCTSQQDVEQNAVVFNDPCGEIPDLSGCAGTLAFGGAFFQLATQTHDGAQWHPAGATFTVVNNGTECIGAVNFAEMMAHELGHTQGFGHHLPTPPPNPTMSAFLKADGRGAAILGADRFCASYAYHTFLDVPFDHFAWRFVEAVENGGITGGCGAGNYCPNAGITRAQMAVFLLLAKEGASYSPPACTAPPFNDVPASDPFCRWIRELSVRGVTGGCGGGNYCPGSAVTRDQMAVFLLRTREGSSYFPPACTVPMFLDVPCSNPFAIWINELVRRGITAGCGGGNYCPSQPNTRAQMAIFLSATFALPLPN